MRPLLLAFATLAACSAAFAQPAELAVTEAWSRATTGAARTGVIYLTVTASQPDRLTGASTPVAATAEVHLSRMEAGVMEMRPVPDGLLVAPGTPIHMAPGGYHLMLMGLRQPLNIGDHIPVTLTFEHAGAVTTEAVVAGPGATAAPAIK